MQVGSLEILRCPAHFLADALSLVLRDFAPSLRREIAASLVVETGGWVNTANQAFYIALRNGELREACWGQRQPGNIATFWPPQLVGGEPSSTALLLAEHVVAALDETAVEMSQALVAPADADVLPVLEQTGFQRLADLLYLTCERSRFPKDCPSAESLEFTPYNDNQRSRLAALIERTYVNTLDCEALNGVRDIDLVVTGYQATGSYRAENWMLVSHAGNDVGVLLLADHPQAGHWELMYMGIVPEARGQRWGQHISRYAQWMAGNAGADRVVLAVDAVNTPARNMYESTGFEMWDQRTVFIRFPGNASPNNAS